MPTTDPRNLPDGNPDSKANSQMALRFRLDHADEERQDIVDSTADAILMGFMVYLGDHMVRLTKLGLLFLDKGPRQ